jgi:hypothetical protein
VVAVGAVGGTRDGDKGCSWWGGGCWAGVEGSDWIAIVTGEVTGAVGGSQRLGVDELMAMLEKENSGSGNYRVGCECELIVSSRN